MKRNRAANPTQHFSLAVQIHKQSAMPMMMMMMMMMMVALESFKQSSIDEKILRSYAAAAAADGEILKY
jgi:lipopolysaccharide export LptBFGC system permease protein LptF